MGNGTAIISKSKAQELARQYEDYAEETGNQQKEFLKFTKQGQWLHGTEEIAVEDTEEFAFNLSTLARGFICWKSNEVVDEIMSLVSSSGSVVKKDDLDDHGPYDSDMDGWREQASVDVRSLESGIEMSFKTSSRGGLNAISSLSKEFASQLKQNPKELPVPICRLEPGHYKHKEYGKIFFPKIVVERWVPLSEVELSNASS